MKLSSLFLAMTLLSSLIYSGNANAQSASIFRTKTFENIYIGYPSNWVVNPEASSNLWTPISSRMYCTTEFEQNGKVISESSEVQLYAFIRDHRRFLNKLEIASPDRTSNVKLSPPKLPPNSVYKDSFCGLQVTVKFYSYYSNTDGRSFKPTEFTILDYRSQKDFDVHQVIADEFTYNVFNFNVAAGSSSNQCEVTLEQVDMWGLPYKLIGKQSVDGPGTCDLSGAP